MKTKLNILQLQDPATEAESIRNILTNDKLHFEITFADTKDKFIQALINSRFDVILHNDHVPFLTAVEALDILNEKNIKTPFILISSPQNDLFTAAIFKKGATDYISKKELFRITAAITAAIENNRNREPEILQLSKEGNGEVANEIQRQSARLIEALAVAKVGSWETDLQTFDIKWSEETHHIYETDPKEFTVSYENYLSFLHPDDSISVIAAFENSFNSETINSVEHRIIAANGIIKYVIENWKISRDPKGRPLVAIGTCQDITEKKSLEKAIENERDQFIDMFLNAPSAIGMLRGAEHVFEMVNPLYLQLTGKKDIIGKTVLEVFPEVVEQGFIGILDTVYTTGKPYIGTEVLMKVNKEGNGELTDSYANFIYQAYRNTEGNVEGIFFFINDITEQILSRKAIEKSEKFFKGVIENSDDMITMLDGTGKTIYASPAVSKKFGYTNAECLNLNINDVIHPDDVLKMQEFIMKLMMHPGVPMECPLVREMKKDGSYIWAEGTLTNFLETEGINAIVGNFRDVTEKKKLESLLNKSNRLARIGSWEFDVNSKSVFWSDITKEIREVAPDFNPRLDDGIS
ncbi:MAG: PAS domain S-box protein, partial [Ferruginibacter sp.]